MLSDDEFRQSYIDKMKPHFKEKSSIHHLFKDYPKEISDLLLGMLTLDPKDRLSAKELLRNPLFDPYRQKDSELGSDVWILPKDVSTEEECRAHILENMQKL